MKTHKMQCSGVKRLGRLGAVAAALTALTLAGAANADDKKVAGEYVIKKDDIKGDKDKKKSGIDWQINAGANLNLSNNRSVVGQVDGSTIAVGFKFDAALTYHDGPHEWRNSMAIAAGVTRTPAIPDFVKSQDQVDIESIYLYHFNDWLGGYARVAWSSQLFRGTDVRGGPTPYEISYLDGTVDQDPGLCGVDGEGNLVPCINRIRLTDPLRPSRFKESIGLFAQPITKDPFSLESRLGLGGRQTLAKGQLAIQDNPDGTETPQVEVVELDDVLQLGAEGVVEVWGHFEEKRITYKAGAEVMIPFLTNDDTDRGVLDLTNVLLYANVGFKVVEWASIDYTFRALREPQLLDAWQIQNQLLLTMGLSAGSKKEEKK